MYEGIIQKMFVQNTAPVQYILPIGDKRLALNNLIGKEIYISFQNKINCLKCGSSIKKTYVNGFCYQCYISAPETSACLFNPEKCEAHLGIARDLEWSKKNCLQEHIVYLSISSHVKVGVTRLSQVPTRWLDQGAIKAIKIAITPYRELAGQIEIDLKQYYSSQTSWQAMLKNKIKNADLIFEKQKAINYLKSDLKKYLCTDNTTYTMQYPVIEYPEKIKAVNLDKQSEIKSVLTGIKGQYLIFKNGNVLNIRKHSGYFITIKII